MVTRENAVEFRAHLDSWLKLAYFEEPSTGVWGIVARIVKLLYTKKNSNRVYIVLKIPCIISRIKHDFQSITWKKTNLEQIWKPNLIQTMILRFRERERMLSVCVFVPLSYYAQRKKPLFVSKGNQNYKY